MHEQDIITFLSLVGDELQEIGVEQPIRLLLIGGAYMLTQIHNRATTQDIDVIVLGLPSDTEEYRIFKQAVDFVAHDQKMSRAWLSDNIAQFLQSSSKIPNGKLWLSKGKLEVYIPDPRYILALKLLSGRKKDMSDIEALLNLLGIKTQRQAEALLKRYINQETRKSYVRNLQATFDILFD